MRKQVIFLGDTVTLKLLAIFPSPVTHHSSVTSHPPIHARTCCLLTLPRGTHLSGELHEPDAYAIQAAQCINLGPDLSRCLAALALAYTTPVDQHVVDFLRYFGLYYQGAWSTGTDDAILPLSSCNAQELLHPCLPAYLPTCTYAHYRLVAAYYIHTFEREKRLHGLDGL